jgi:hypothetical protein
MPSVKVHDRDRAHDRDSDFSLKIGWSKESEHVQVATIAADDARTLRPTPEGNGWFVQMDRHGINRAIRALRQARDDAFGKDA